MATHIFLDHFGALVFAALLGVKSELQTFSWGSDRIVGFLFPFLGAKFPPYVFENLADQLSFFKRLPMLFGEVIGLTILIIDFLKYKKARWKI